MSGGLHLDWRGLITALGVIVGGLVMLAWPQVFMPRNRPPATPPAGDANVAQRPAWQPYRSYGPPTAEAKMRLRARYVIGLGVVLLILSLLPSILHWS